VEAVFAGGFTGLDWAIVGGVLLITTIIGERLAGKQASMRDFFLAGRRLPWPIVSASIVATEISAVTYISLPSVVAKPGGDITYLQLGLIGSFLARAIIGYVLVPAYYEREIYSPYDYMGARLGEGVRRMTTVLFSLGGVLGQSARVYLTAVVLQVLLHRELGWVEAQLGLPPLVTAVAAIGIVAVVWTWIGGIAAVVWTDAILFLLFLVGIGVALVTVGQAVDGGLAAALADGAAAGKFRFFDFDTDPTKSYTFWAALIAATWGGVGSYGTDQLMAQRLFCCKDAAGARKAILASIVAMGVTFLCAVVGVGLWAYYREHPMSDAAAALLADQPDRLFPIFITEVVPPGFKGLAIAGAFAAAISSLDSIMAALSQTTLSALYLPARRRRLAARGAREDEAAEARHTVRASRALVLIWGVILCAAAVGVDKAAQYETSILDLALTMASYTGGALVAGFFLAFLPMRRDGSGFLFSAPLSVMVVFAIKWHAGWARWTCVGAAVLLAALYLAFRVMPDLRSPEVRRGTVVARAAILLGGLALMIWIAFAGTFEGRAHDTLAFPWLIPAGSAVAFTFGWLLARPLPRTSSRA